MIFMKKKLIIVCVITSIFSYIFYDYLQGEKDKEKRKLFSKVQKEMSKVDVINLLGNPDTIIYGIDSSNFTYEYFTEEYTGTLKSGMPSVVFDSTGKVLFTSFGD